MALEPEAPTTDEGPNAELIDMTRRFWVGVVLTLPLLALAMAEMFDPAFVHSLPTPLRLWGQLLLAAPVVLWAAGHSRARLAVHREPQPVHVHADRAGHNGGCSARS